MRSSIFVIISCYVSLVIVLLRLNRSPVQIKILLGAALITSSFSLGLPLIISDLSGELTKWNRILSITFTLTILSFLIRQFKPVYTRYPAVFIYLPFLIVLVYPFINEALVIDNMLNILLQGGALLIIIILLLSMKRQVPKASVFIAGILLMFISYVIYWFVPDLNEHFPSIWKLCFGSGILLIGFRISEVIYYAGAGMNRQESKGVR